jgi:hypothetical protein
MNKSILAMLLLSAFPAVSFARGESWVPKPPPPPPLSTLTNEARYIEWKWRCDVTDCSTGVDNATASSEVLRLAAELEPTEPWNVVKARCFAYLCDNIAIDVSPYDWFPALPAGIGTKDLCRASFGAETVKSQRSSIRPSGMR